MKPPPAEVEGTRRSKRRRHARAPSDDATAQQNDSSGEEYRVGPGHPPRESQFKPGVSGNPKGANLVVQLGLATEDLNRRWYEANTGQVITDIQNKVPASGAARDGGDSGRPGPGK